MKLYLLIISSVLVGYFSYLTWDFMSFDYQDSVALEDGSNDNSDPGPLPGRGIASDQSQLYAAMEQIVNKNADAKSANPPNDEKNVDGFVSPPIAAIDEQLGKIDQKFSAIFSHLPQDFIKNQDAFRFEVMNFVIEDVNFEEVERVKGHYKEIYKVDPDNEKLLQQIKENRFYRVEDILHLVKFIQGEKELLKHLTSNGQNNDLTEINQRIEDSLREVDELIDKENEIIFRRTSNE